MIRQPEVKEYDLNKEEFLRSNRGFSILCK